MSLCYDESCFHEWVLYYTDELHQGRVPPSNAWHDVSYIAIDSDRGTAKCELCPTGVMLHSGGRKGGTISQHVNGKNHRKKHSALCTGVATELRNVANLERYSVLEEKFCTTEGIYRQLGGLLDNQKAAVCMLLYTYVARSYNVRSKSQVRPEGVAADAESLALLGKAQALVKKYTRLETAVILDLALLKATISPEFDTVDELRDAFCLAHSADESVTDLDPASSILSWAKNRRSVNGSAVAIQLIMARNQ
jgi:hypothetical protein